ncbi:exportin 1-like protein [Necator americanus]|uniref:Exportin-T n=1 Tax=Necator americanus TaxID=51031 RepID=W2SKD7_NECAM|nr:exportin 1-like protein [Necator americanus]ETN69296.1 exportin 1-like protein [Necator americanus]
MTAVNTALNGNPFGAPGSINDPSKQTQALKTDENGWRKSTDNIVANNLSTDEEHFLLLQVIEDYLARRYVEADADSVMCIRNLLSHWIQTLLAIDSEVVDRDIQRSKTVFDRNTKIKDFMRDLCIPQIVQSWWTILERCSDTTAQCLCLDAVAAFVDWIDVELVANDVFVPLVIARLGNKDTSEAAVRAVSALIQKGMPPSKKLSLVTALTDVMRSNHLISVNPNSDYEDVLRAGSLLSAVGSVLIDTYHK